MRRMLHKVMSQHLSILVIERSTSFKINSCLVGEEEDINESSASKIKPHLTFSLSVLILSLSSSP